MLNLVKLWRFWLLLLLSEWAIILMIGVTVQAEPITPTIELSATRSITETVIITPTVIPNILEPSITKPIFISPPLRPTRPIKPTRTPIEPTPIPIKPTPIPFNQNNNSQVYVRVGSMIIFVILAIAVLALIFIFLNRIWSWNGMTISNDFIVNLVKILLVVLPFVGLILGYILYFLYGGG